MLKGRYGDTTGRPYIEGRLSIPRLGLRGDISFIVDTGADKSVLMPLDANRLGVDYSQLNRSYNTIGIGGYSKNYIESAMLAFAEPKALLHVYLLEIYICTPSPEIADIPSLLGRDILDRWKITFHKSNDDLFADVVSADVQIGPSNQRKRTKRKKDHNS